MKKNLQNVKLYGAFLMENANFEKEKQLSGQELEMEKS